MSIYNTILCLGDSLTYGSRDEYRRGYPPELAKLLNEYTTNQFWVVINEGINQERSGDILRRTPKVIATYPDAYAVIILAGTNDTLEGVPEDVYKDTMYQIIKTCQNYHNIPGGRKIILGSLISLYGVGLLSYSNIGNEWLKKYNLVLKDLAEVMNIPFVNLTSLEKYRIDRCHLNNEGYKEMAKLFFEELIKI